MASPSASALPLRTKSSSAALHGQQQPCFKEKATLRRTATFCSAPRPKVMRARPGGQVLPPPLLLRALDLLAAFGLVLLVHGGLVLLPRAAVDGLLLAVAGVDRVVAGAAAVAVGAKA